MAINLRYLLLLAFIIPFVATIPTTEAPHSPIAPLQDNISRPFRKLRDAIIEKIWSVPQKVHSKPNGHYQHSSIPSNFHAKYDGDVVLRFNFSTQDEVKAISEAASILYVDVWDSTQEWVDIRIAKEMVPSLLGLLPPSLHKNYTPLIRDLAQAVYETYPTSPSPEDNYLRHGQTSPHTAIASPSSGHHDVFFRDYQPLSVLYPWLRLMASMFPSHVRLSSIGLSSEGRDIPALRIGARPDLPPDHKHPTRDTILITGGSHAREWISVSTAAYVAYDMLTRYGNPRFPYVTKILDHFDIIFVPTINPDGYEYTWKQDRLWRKNRQSTHLNYCPGFDIDRSFGFGWDGDKAIDNPCGEDYPGTGPFEAVEAKVLADWARNETEHNNVTFMAYLDLHSYSQQVLYPYSYSCRIVPPNLEDLEEVAVGLAKSFRLTNGHYYGVSSACEGDITMKDKKASAGVKIQSQGGSALDYFYHEMHIKYAYQIKLRDQGTYGFLLPRSHIIPSGIETYEAVVGMGRWLLGNHGIESIADPENPQGTPEKQEDEADLQAKVKTHEIDEPVVEDEEIEDDETQFELRRRRRR